jgi:hypothetical protein
MSMRALAKVSQSNGNVLSASYGTDPNKASTWDADFLHMCHCDLGVLDGATPLMHNSRIGIGCSLKTCYLGDDPWTQNQQNDEQQVSCVADGGQIRLKFRGAKTTWLAYNADAAILRTALEGLTTIDSLAEVTMASSVLCSSLGSTTAIEFNGPHGNLPLLEYDTSRLSNSPGLPVSVSTTKESTGNKEWVECSNRGRCDRAQGVCICHEGMASSDGNGGLGGRKDCGHILSHQGGLKG